MSINDDNQQIFEQSQKMEALGTLASGIAHDFNNILQGLYNSLFDLELSLQDQPHVLEKLVTTYQLADQAKELVQQILTYSRQQEGDFKVFSPVSAIQEVVEIMRSGHRPMIPIHLEIDTPHVLIHGDELQIKQVLLNLIANAFHAMSNLQRPLLKIFVTTKTMTSNHRRYLSLSIVDNGHGISKQHQRRIFEPFFTTKNVGEGSGLGLSVVQGIVAKHGGSIDVESEPNCSTAFTIHLPLHIDDPKKSTYKNLIYKGKEDILLVAPFHDSYRNFATILDQLGHEVTQCHHGLEAFQHVQAKQSVRDFVLIMDQQLPDLSAIELVRKLRQFHFDIPILVVQGRYPHEVALELPDSLLIMPVDYSVIQFDKDRLQSFLHSFALP